MYDLAQFSLKEATECGAALRKLSAGARSLEEVAGRIVRYLHAHLGDPRTGEQACVLVRFFKTHPYEELAPDLQRFALAMLNKQPVPPRMKCFTLMATAGQRPEWNSRETSLQHKAIPCPSKQFVDQLPMFSQLLVQFGVTVDQLQQSGAELQLDQQEKSFNVFYVPEALGSPYVPAQSGFVIPFGIRSALLFGGVLPSGNLFAIILFARVHIPREAAELFKTLALCAKIAVLPFDGGEVFARKRSVKGERAHETQRGTPRN